MNSLLNNNRINLLGEFACKDMESKFLSQYMERSANYLRIMSIVLGLLNTFFIIPDYFFNVNKYTFYTMLIGRVVFITIMLIFSFQIARIKKYQSLVIWITFCEALAVILFLFVYYEYETPDYLIQSFGAIVIIIAVFIIPNRWINTAAVSLLLLIGFFMVSYLRWESISSSNFIAGALYLIILFIACLCIALRNNVNERIQYINRNELIRLSVTDPLSGAYNRFKMDEELDKWVKYSKRYSLPLSVAIFDFDDFKNINDTYGHLAGDNVILESSAIIKKCIRQSDIFARWGGEEFMLLFPNTSIYNALESSNRIRREIEEKTYVDNTNITCSVGLAQLSKDDDITNLINKADKALYNAKSKGKNKAVVYGSCDN